jgi:hypothetical protein
MCKHTHLAGYYRCFLHHTLLYFYPRICDTSNSGSSSLRPSKECDKFMSLSKARCPTESHSSLACPRSQTSLFHRFRRLLCWSLVFWQFGIACSSSKLVIRQSNPITNGLPLTPLLDRFLHLYWCSDRLYPSPRHCQPA